MAYTQEDIDALKAALSTGATSVERGDEKVTYRSLKDMEAQLAKMQAEVAGKRGASKVKVHYPRLGRGV